VRHWKKTERRWCKHCRHGLEEEYVVLCSATPNDAETHNILPGEYKKPSIREPESFRRWFQYRSFSWLGGSRAWMTSEVLLRFVGGLCSMSRLICMITGKSWLPEIQALIQSRIKSYVYL
jgi:hypothetical protein